jgi:hypothetical protein
MARPFFREDTLKIEVIAHLCCQHSKGHDGQTFVPSVTIALVRARDKTLTTPLRDDGRSNGSEAAALFPFAPTLALQLHFSLEVSAARVSLVSASPE